MAKYTPGNEPDNIKKRLNTLFAKLDTWYPDKIVTGLNTDHKKAGETVTELYRLLEYPDGPAFLKAYGYGYVQKQSTGRPKGITPQEAIEILKKRYPEGNNYTSPADLFEANPDLPFKTISNQATQAFGMPLKKYLISVGLLGDKTQDAFAVIEELKKRYPNGSLSTKTTELIKANPDLKAAIDKLSTQAAELFGMSVKEYLLSIGLLSEKNMYYLVRVLGENETVCCAGGNLLPKPGDYVEILPANPSPVFGEVKEQLTDLKNISEVYFPDKRAIKKILNKSELKKRLDELLNSGGMGKAKCDQILEEVFPPKKTNGYLTKLGKLRREWNDVEYRHFITIECEDDDGFVGILLEQKDKLEKAGIEITGYEENWAIDIEFEGDNGKNSYVPGSLGEACDMIISKAKITDVRKTKAALLNTVCSFSWSLMAITEGTYFAQKSDDDVTEEEVKSFVYEPVENLKEKDREEADAEIKAKDNAERIARETAEAEKTEKNAQGKVERIAREKAEAERKAREEAERIAREKAEAASKAKEDAERKKKETLENYEKEYADWKVACKETLEKRNAFVSASLDNEKRKLEAEAANARYRAISAANAVIAEQTQRKAQAEKTLASLGLFRFSEKKTQNTIIEESTRLAAEAQQSIAAAETAYRNQIAVISLQVKEKEGAVKDEAEKQFPLPSEPTKPTIVTPDKEDKQEASSLRGARLGESKKRVLSILEAAEKEMTPTDVAIAYGQDVKVQEINSMLSQLVESGYITRTIKQRRSYFKIK